MTARPLAVDLFAGAGGLSLGFEQAGFDIAAAVEFDPVHAATHEFNFPYGTTLCTDVAVVTGTEIREKSNIGDRDVDAVIGGAPCQGFSLIGRRALDDPRNRLVAEFARLVEELQPRFFVLENVAGLTIGRHRIFLDEVIARFERSGYKVRQPYRVLQAAEYGVPQSRRRLFLLGAREDQRLPDYPVPTTSGRTFAGSGTGRESLPLVASVLDAIGDLPDADVYPELLEGDCILAKFSDPSAYASGLREQATVAHYGRTRTGWDSDVLTSSARTLHTQISISRFEATRPGSVEPISRFLRLHPDGICNTLRAGTASDRGAFTSPRPIHPLFPRCITVREAARLHGFPDWFRFHVTKWHGFRQIGNSVPPPLARAVANQVMHAADHRPRRGPRTALADPDLLEAPLSALAVRYGVDRHVIAPRRRGA